MSSSYSQAATQDGFVYDAFISYSRKNSDIADKIERDLQKFPLTRGLRKRLGRPNLDVFRDVNDLTGNRLTPTPVEVRTGEAWRQRRSTRARELSTEVDSGR